VVISYSDIGELCNKCAEKSSPGKPKILKADLSGYSQRLFAIGQMVFNQAASACWEKSDKFWILDVFFY